LITVLSDQLMLETMYALAKFFMDSHPNRAASSRVRLITFVLRKAVLLERII
jgi:hypothetical protein